MFGYLVDFFYFIDIVVNFRTTYLSKLGDEIFDSKKIAIHYIFQGSFVIDFLASFPFSAVGGSGVVLELMGMLKLARITRITKIINKLDIDATTKAVRQSG